MGDSLKFVKVFNSFKEAEQDMRAEWKKMAPEERVKEMLRLRDESWKVTGKRVEGLRRIVSVVERPSR